MSPGGIIREPREITKLEMGNYSQNIETEYCYGTALY
jgi:hypothetical protein